MQDAPVAVPYLILLETSVLVRVRREEKQVIMWQLTPPMLRDVFQIKVPKMEGGMGGLTAE